MEPGRVNPRPALNPCECWTTWGKSTEAGVPLSRPYTCPDDTSFLLLMKEPSCPQHGDRSDSKQADFPTPPDTAEESGCAALAAAPETWRWLCGFPHLSRGAIILTSALRKDKEDRAGSGVGQRAEGGGDSRFWVVGKTSWRYPNSG